MKHTKLTFGLMTIVFVLALVTSNLFAQPGSGRGRQSGGGMGIENLPLEELSGFEKTTLTFMREEEKLARDVYLALYDIWEAPVFKNIAKSEQQHTDMIAKLLAKYELEDPFVDEAGVFSNETLQQLYHDLVNIGSASLADTYQVGATIEDLDIFDLEEALKEIDNADIRTVYQNLMKGSRNHMRSFYSLLKSTGVEYQAQYISSKLLEQIVTSERERGPVDADGNPTRNTGNGRGQNRSDRQSWGQTETQELRAGNYPNPANPTTTISYELPKAAPVTLSIYNMRGQQLQSYSFGTQNAGTYELTWDARDQYGSDVSSGVYLYRLQAGDQALAQQFTLLK